MPRLPTVTYAGDDDLTTGDYGTASSRSVLHPVNRSQSPSPSSVASPQQQENSAGGSASPTSPNGTPSPTTHTPHMNHHGSILFNTSRAERPQLAHDYPQIAFTSKRELQHEMQTAANTVTRDANGRVVRRPNLFVFGVGSYGLRDNASSVSSPMQREDGAESVRKQTTNGCTALTTHTAAGQQQQHPQGGGGAGAGGGHPAASKRGKEALHHAGDKDGAAATRLPAIAGTAGHRSSQSGGGGGTVSSAVPFAPRPLRCGGVIDTFSYFSVHRVHPELYTK